MNDAEKISSLRAQLAELEGNNSASQAADHEHRSGAGRAVAATILIVVACVLAPLSVVSVWASTIVSDTDRYVETVAPVADDPGVQAAIADQVTTAIMDSLDIQGLTTDVVNTLAAQPNMPPRVADALPALAAPLTRGIEDFTRTQAANLMASPQFKTVWDEVNRAAHAQVVKVLEGNAGGAISAQNGQITLNLGPVIEEVKARLVDRGFALAEKVPAIDKNFVLVESTGITKLQRGYSLLNALGLWLPFIALGSLAGGVMLARDRRRALLRGALGVTGAMIVLGVTLTLVRTLYVETTPGNVLTSESAGNVFDILIRFLRTGLRATAVLALLVALAAFLTGPSPSARRARSLFDRGIGSARSGADAAGWHLDPVTKWVTAHRNGLRLTVFIIGGLTLMFWAQPTPWTVVGVAVVVALALAVIAFLGRPPEPRAALIPRQATAEDVPSGAESSSPHDSVEPPQTSGTGSGPRQR